MHLIVTRDPKELLAFQEIEEMTAKLSALVILAFSDVSVIGKLHCRDLTERLDLQDLLEREETVELQVIKDHQDLLVLWGRL